MKKYIVFGLRSDYTETAYFDAIKRKDVYYCKSTLARKYLSFCNIKKVRINKIFLRFLFALFLLKYHKRDELYFVYHGIDNAVLAENGFCDYCRKKRPLSHHIGLFWDVFDFENKIDPLSLKKRMDFLVTIDKDLALKYGILYYPLFYSKKYQFIKKKGNGVFFCGEDGGRLKILKSIARFLKENDIKYSFYCSNSKDEHIDELSIHYITRMEHDKYLEELSDCAVLLDLTKPGAKCCSLRFCEAVLYDKKLLSDNINIRQMPAFDGCYMAYFDDIRNVNIDFLTHGDNVVYNNKDSVKPDGFIDFISKL